MTSSRPRPLICKLSTSTHYHTFEMLCAGVRGDSLAQPCIAAPLFLTQTRPARVQQSRGNTSRHAAARHAPAARLAAAAAGGGSRGAAANGSASNSGGVLAAFVDVLRSRLEEAVKAELTEQQRQQAAAYSRHSAKRLQADGLVLLGLQAAPQGRMFADFVWQFAPPGGTQLPYHRFKRGDTVVLARQDGRQRQRAAASGNGSRRYSSSSSSGSDSGDEGDNGSAALSSSDLLEGTVLEVKRGHLQVAASKQVAEQLGAAGPGALWRLDQVCTEQGGRGDAGWQWLSMMPCGSSG